MSFIYRRIALSLLLVAASAAWASDHQHVAGDALRTPECYILKTPETRLWAYPGQTRDRLEVSVPARNIVCVREVRWNGGRPWYRVLLMKMGTLDRRQHVPGWIDSRELVKHGAALSY